MCKSTGVCGSFFRILLILLNAVVFVIGAAILGLGIGLKYIPQVAELITIPDFEQIVQPLFIFLVSFGGFLVLVSLFGLIGSCCGNRCFLVLYEIVIGSLLLVHLILFILAIIFAGNVKDEFKKLLDNGLKKVLDNYDNLNNQYNISSLPPDLIPTNITDEIKDNCKYYTVVTEVLQCCDFNATYQILAIDCCATNSSQTCIDRIFGAADDYTSLLIYLPNGITLGFELVIFLAVIYVIVKLSKHKEKESRRRREQVELGRRSKYDRYDR